MKSVQYQPLSVTVTVSDDLLFHDIFHTVDIALLLKLFARYWTQIFAVTVPQQSTFNSPGGVIMY